MNAHIQPSANTMPAVIVFGKDEGGKAHASSFIEADADLARKAADLMGMSVLTVSTEAAKTIASKLPKGRVFASGKGFVPFVAASLFAEITALHRQLAVDEPDAASQPDTNAEKEAGLKAVDAIPAQPKDWAEIRIGTIVLAAAAPRHTEWFEVQVVGDDGHDVLTLRYCDWPQEAPFERHRDDLALMHPARQLAPPVEPEQPAGAA